MNEVIMRNRALEGDGYHVWVGVQAQGDIGKVRGGHFVSSFVTFRVTTCKQVLLVFQDRISFCNSPGNLELAPP